MSVPMSFSYTGGDFLRYCYIDATLLDHPGFDRGYRFLVLTTMSRMSVETQESHWPFADIYDAFQVNDTWSISAISITTELIDPLSFQNLPVELVIQILSYLHPLDLLMWARVSKDYRVLLLSRGSKSIWVSSRHSCGIEGLPECPPHLSEPRYAALLFTDACQACGGRSAFNFDRTLLLRFCDRCYKKNFKEGYKLWGRFKNLQVNIHNLIPRHSCIREHRSYESGWPIHELKTNSTVHKYYKKQFNSIAIHLQSLVHDSPEFKTYINEIRATSNDQIQHGHAMRHWDIHMRSQRRADTKVRLLAMGYTEAQLPEPGANNKWEKLMNEPRPVTNNEWRRIKDKVERILAAVARLKRDKRLSSEFLTEYRLRRKDISDPLRSWLPLDFVADSHPVVHSALYGDDVEVYNVSEDIEMQLRVQRAIETAWTVAEGLKNSAEVSILSQLQSIDTQNMKQNSNGPGSLYHASTIYICERCADGHSRPVTLHTLPSLLQHLRWRSELISWQEWRPKVSIDATHIARRTICALGLPNDISLYDLPTRYVCDCLKPGLILPMDFFSLIRHILDETAWYNAVTSRLSPSRDRDLVIYNDHDFDINKVFVHISGQDPLPQFDAGTCKPIQTEAKSGYCCSTCLKLVGNIDALRCTPPHTYYSPGDDVRFFHHVKTKHLKSATSEDATMLTSIVSL
ncbi:hypothetical protein QCA50_019776 [Cerrena zonata]|uniref:F-box domain-containing protein n=1 Tax=Cerrena zonata TaxID=2478898 RepID=A0AAW0FKT3_9APHY